MKKFLLLVLMCVSVIVFAQNWEQLGQDLIAPNFEF